MVRLKEKKQCIISETFYQYNTLGPYLNGKFSKKVENQWSDYDSTGKSRKLHSTLSWFLLIKYWCYFRKTFSADLKKER